MNLTYLFFKFGLSAAALVAVSEIAKRSSVWAALVAYATTLYFLPSST
jgi:hypothetical protein